MAQRSRRRNKNRFTGEPNGLQPGDDIGNRRPKKVVQLPPDDLGNRKTKEDKIVIPDDDVGNRVDIPPTHEHSAALDGGRKRKKRAAPLVRVGRFFAGGVNPLVSHNLQRATKALDGFLEVQKAERAERRAAERAERMKNQGQEPQVSSGKGGGQDAQLLDLQARRAARFFDFVEDDRFEYQLKSDPEDKRAQAEDAVQQVLQHAGRDATVTAQVVEDGKRTKVLVAIDERGPQAGLPDARKPENSKDPLFVLGNAALMSLNYLVNKIVNRYPNDRIRLVVLPKKDEATYLETFDAHRRKRDGLPPKEEAQAEAPTAEAPKAEAPKAEAPKVEAPKVEEPKAEEPKAEEPKAEDGDVPVDDDATDAKPVKKVAKKKATKKKATKKTAAKKTTAKKAADDGDEGDAEASTDVPASDDADEAKPAAKKTTAKKATAKKAAAKKTTAKKATAKKTTAKKAPAKKATAKKAPAKKATAKKTAAKKATAKKADSDVADPPADD